MDKVERKVESAKETALRKAEVVKEDIEEKVEEVKEKHRPIWDAFVHLFDCVKRKPEEEPLVESRLEGLIGSAYQQGEIEYLENEKVAIALLTVATAAPTVSNGASEVANDAPKPLAAVDVAAKDFVAPFAFLESDLVACEVLFKEDIAFLASTLKVTILSAT